MKLSASAAVAAVLASLNGNHDGAYAFVTPSPSSQLQLGAPRVASSALHTLSPDDPYSSVLDAISSAADAANAAAAKSSSLAASLHVPSSMNVNIDMSNVDMAGINDAALSSLGNVMTPEAISAAQAKLSVLEANLATSSDPAVMSKALVDALDASVRAAEHAASSASVLTANLNDFDAVLANSMAIYDAQNNAHLLSPEAAEAAQAKLALLVHNLSGATLDDAFVANSMAGIDRRLDEMSAAAGMGNVSGSTVMLYSTVALALAYSQQEAGVRGYKKELRKKLEGGELDIDALAKDVGVAPANVEVEAPLEDPAIGMVAMADEAPLEDPAIAMAAMADEKMDTLPKKTQSETEEGQKRVEALLTTAAVPTPPTKVVVAVAAPVVATPKPPADDVPMDTLMKAAASEDIATSKLEESAAVVEFSAKKETKVAIQKDKRAVPKRVAPAGNRPAASPLARLLAEELGLDLRNLEKGSGKNGKILIDDVRQFQARMEEASVAMADGRPFFAAVSV